MFPIVYRHWLQTQLTKLISIQYGDSLTRAWPLFLSAENLKLSQIN